MGRWADGQMGRWADGQMVVALHTHTHIHTHTHTLSKFFSTSMTLSVTTLTSRKGYRDIKCMYGDRRG
jgi:hypothetical protein